jgi:hypothetical protein
VLPGCSQSWRERSPRFLPAPRRHSTLLQHLGLNSTAGYSLWPRYLDIIIAPSS